MSENQFNKSNIIAKEQIDAKLRDVQLLEFKGSLSNAVNAMKQLTDEYPLIADYWEFYGDLLVKMNQFEQAKNAYYQAKEIQKPRLNAEKKYADLVFRIASPEIPFISEDPPGNGGMALFLSLMLPGAGQLYNKDYLKSGVFFTIWLFVMIPVFSVLGEAGNIKSKGNPYESFHVYDVFVGTLTNGPGLFLLILLFVLMGVSAGEAYYVCRKRGDGAKPIFTAKGMPAMLNMETLKEEAKIAAEKSKKPEVEPKDEKDK